MREVQRHPEVRALASLEGCAENISPSPFETPAFGGLLRVTTSLTYKAWNP